MPKLNYSFLILSLVITAIFCPIANADDGELPPAGLNVAVGDTTDVKSYNVTAGSNVSGDLGQLQGGEAASLSIIGDNQILDGETFSGIVTSTGQTLDIQDAASIENFESTNGGFVDNAGSLTSSNVTYTGNKATVAGGAIYNTGVMKSENDTFKNNGDFGVNDQDLQIQTIEGGALYNIGSMELVGAQFESNKAQHGAAIYNKGTLTITNTDDTKEFINNYAIDSGGAIFNLSNLTVSGAVFKSNRSYEGGALYNAGISTILSSAFNNNTAQKGAGIYNDAVGEIVVDTIEFYGNIAEGTDGAGIYNAGKINLTNADFGSNNAQNGNGGAIANKGELIISASSFDSNIVDNGEGGAIYNAASENNVVTVDGSSFSGNSAGNEGGAIANSGKIIISDSTFNNNGSLNHGGAISNSGTLEITDSSFSDNGQYGDEFDDNPYTAKGGAISNTGTLNLTNVVFSNNQAINGGAIWSSGDVNINADNGASTFSGNTASGDSNAIYMAAADKNLNLNIKNGGLITIDDGVDGINGYGINITGDGKGGTTDLSKGGVTLNGVVNNAGNVTVTDANLSLGANADLSGSSLSLSNSFLNLSNDSNQTVNLGSFNSTGSSIAFDADFATGNSDKIIADNASGNINLDAINILGDGSQDINLFVNGGVNFDNLDDFVAYTDTTSYTFNQDNGTLSIKSQTMSDGLNDAVSGTAQTRSLSVTSDQSISADLGTMGGGDGSQLSIIGNGNIFDGAGFGGLITSDTQTVNITDTKSVEGFNSVDGGFIKNSGALNVQNTSFKNNTAAGNGGAIWSDSDVNILANNGNVLEFSGNTANGVSNAIHMASADASLNLQAVNGSIINFDDGISGVDGYALNIYGDNQSSIAFNEAVRNAGTITIAGSNVSLGQDDYLNGSNLVLTGGDLHLNNGDMLNTAEFKSLTGGNGLMHLDVDTASGASDQLRVDDLHGNVKIVAHQASGPVTFAAAPATTAAEQSGIKFAEVANAGTGTFDIYRVVGSAFDWEAAAVSQADGSTDWLMNILTNASGANPIVNAETVAYLGLNSAGIEQSRSMVRNIENKIASNMRYNGCCGLYDGAYNGDTLYNVWASPVYSSSEVNAPFEFDADISGMEAGGDVQLNPYNRVGVFASYRRGKYDFSGKSDIYSSLISSKIDIDSYLAGLYYRYNQGNFWTMATAFGGIQQADIKTADGLNADTDGTELGGSITAGYGIEINNRFVIEPTIRATYTQVEFDDVKDSFGKTAQFGTAAQTEFEAGVKFEQTISINDGYVKIYFKPGIIQTMVSGDKVRVTSLNAVETMDDATLGRAEVGFSFAMTQNLSAFGAAGYTFGSDYKDTAFNLGLSYTF